MTGMDSCVDESGPWKEQQKLDCEFGSQFLVMYRSCKRDCGHDHFEVVSNEKKAR